MVGAKSKNMAGLRGKLPDWINLPASVTIPFGSFEKALDEPECKEVKKQLEEAVKVRCQILHTHRSGHGCGRFVMSNRYQDLRACLFLRVRCRGSRTARRKSCKNAATSSWA